MPESKSGALTNLAIPLLKNLINKQYFKLKTKKNPAQNSSPCLLSAF
jgi:hypothetical protein